MARYIRQPPVVVPMGRKYCFQCQTVHLQSAFATDRKMWDRLRPMCRACDASRWQKYSKTPEGAATIERGKAWARITAKHEALLSMPKARRVPDTAATVGHPNASARRSPENALVPKPATSLP